MFRATHPGGQPCHDSLDATNLGQARYILEIRGYRGIEFYSDENADDVKRFALSDTGIDETTLPEWSAAEAAAAQKRRGVWAKLWWAFKQHLVFFGALLIWNWFSLRGERPFSWADKIGFGLSATYLVLFLMMVSPMVFFDQLLQASAWADWAGVRKWVKRTRWLRRITRVGVPELELQIREAYALAAEGYVRDAVQKMEVLKAHPSLTESMYFSRLSTVYEYAGDTDAMVRCAEAAAAKSTGGVGEWIDLATARIRRKCDVAGAKAALEHVEGKEIPILARAALERCRGMIALEEGKFAEAKQQLEQALAGMSEHAGNPLLQNWIAEAKAYLAVALSALGERDRAGKELAEAAPLLKANKEEALLRRANGR
jgi:hypothetical protein